MSTGTWKEIKAYSIDLLLKTYIRMSLLGVRASHAAKNRLVFTMTSLDMDDGRRCYGGQSDVSPSLVACYLLIHGHSNYLKRLSVG